MKIFGMGGFELVIILIVILLIFGPKNLPKLGSALGKTMSNLRSGMNEGKKKKDDEKAADEKAAEDSESSSAGDSKPAEIEGEVESVEPVEAPAADEPNDSNESDGEVELGDEAFKTEEAGVVTDASDSAAASEGDVPKKVRRVVKKKVTSEE